MNTHLFVAVVCHEPRAEANRESTSNGSGHPSAGAEGQTLVPVRRQATPALKVLHTAARGATLCLGMLLTGNEWGAHAAAAATPSPVVPADVNNTNNAVRGDWLNFGWQTFIGLNWPATAPSAATNRGQPDTTKVIGAKAANGALIPTVWLTYRGLGDTMLARAADPGPWNQPLAQPPGSCGPLPSNMPVAPGFAPMLLNMVSKLANTNAIPQDDINEAGGHPLIDQRGRYVTYDVRLNQSEYTYIWTNGYYDAVRQMASFNQPAGFQGFPRTGQESMFNPALPAYAQFGALEVKAAWRVLDPAKDNPARFYTQSGYFLQPDGTCEGPATFGLIGFHILRITPTVPGTWFWATFEHVDNTSVPAGSSLTPSLSPPNTPNGNCSTNYNRMPPLVSGNMPWANTNTPVDVCRVLYPLSSDVQQTNAYWQGQLKGTVWANYELIDTINPTFQATNGYPFPPLQDKSNMINTDTLFNTALETYFQKAHASCMNCHGFALPQGAPNNQGSPLDSTYQIFTFLLLNADSSTPAVKRQAFPRLPLRPASPRL